MVKILVVPSEHVRTESQAFMMDSYHARSISLGTHSVICDRSSQSRIVAAKRVSCGRESHSQSTPASPTPLVRCRAIHSGRDRQTTGPQSSEGYRPRGQAGYPSGLVSTTGSAEVQRVPWSCLSRPPTDLAGSGGAGSPVGAREPRLSRSEKLGRGVSSRQSCESCEVE